MISAVRTDQKMSHKTPCRQSRGYVQLWSILMPNSGRPQPPKILASVIMIIIVAAIIIIIIGDSLLIIY